MNWDLSTRRTAIMNWGHCWVVLGVILRLPFCGDRWFCLPVLFRLYVPKKTATQKNLPFKTKPQLALQMLQLLCKRHEDRHFHAVGDSAYGCKNILLNLPRNCDLTSRLKMDARLYDAPGPNRTGSKGGRPPKRGVRMATPAKMLEGRCRLLDLDIYGRHDKSRVSEAVARCHADPDRPLKIVAVEPLSGGRKPQAFFSTCPKDSAVEVLTRYACRWPIEVTYHDVKGHLGFEEPQGWTRCAVRRTAPLAMLLYSLVTLWFAAEGHRHYQPSQWPWYQAKPHASFADMLATLRTQSVKTEVSAWGIHGQGSRNLVNTLLHMVKLVA